MIGSSLLHPSQLQDYNILTVSMYDLVGETHLCSGVDNIEIIGIFATRKFRGMPKLLDSTRDHLFGRSVASTASVVASTDAFGGKSERKQMNTLLVA